MADELTPFELPLHESRLITVKDPAVIGHNFQSLKNMRYTGAYPKAIGGMTPINTSAPSTGGAAYPRIKSAIHFRKEGETSDYENTLVYAYKSDMTSPKIFRHSQNVPSTGNFNNTPLFSLSDTTSERDGTFCQGPNGTVGFADGKDVLIWGGDEYQLGRFINFSATGGIWKDFTLELRNTINDSQNRAILTKSTTSSTMLFYIGAAMPLQGFKNYFDNVSTKNNSTGTLVVKYWSGSAWTAVSSLVDGTSSGNKPLRATGSVTFASTASVSKTKIIDGTALYWYRVSSSGVATNSHIGRITVNTPMQALTDIWDGELRDTVSFKLYDGTRYTEYNVNVLDDEYSAGSSATFVNIAGAGYHVICGYLEKTAGIEFHIMNGYGNTNASTLTVQYSSNGKTWTNVSNLVDETSSGGASMKVSGVASWTPPNWNAEFQTTVETSEPLWYYKFTWSAALSSPTRVYYVGGITAPQQINGYKSLMLSKNRLWLISNEDDKKNTMRCSAVDAPNVLNGSDTIEISFGDKSEIIGGISLFTVFGSNIFDTLVIFKRNAMFGLTGSTPDDFQRYEISTKDGLVAFKTLVKVFSYLGQSPFSGLIWQGAKGLYLFDGRYPIPISEDINNFFDSRESASRKLHSSYIEKSVGWVDQQYSEYHWFFADGNSTGQLNREYVFDLKKAYWYEVDRGSSADLQFGFEVQDNNSYRYYYGVQNNGIMCRLENGNTFNSNDMDFELWTGDMLLQKEKTAEQIALRKFKLIAKSSTATTASYTVRHYVDGKTNASSSFTLSPLRTGYRIINAKKSLVGQAQGIFHSLRINISTSNESIGFQPLYIGGFYERVREDI